MVHSKEDSMEENSLHLVMLRMCLEISLAEKIPLDNFLMMMKTNLCTLALEVWVVPEGSNQLQTKDFKRVALMIRLEWVALEDLVKASEISEVLEISEALVMMTSTLVWAVVLVASVHSSLASLVVDLDLNQLKLKHILKMGRRSQELKRPL